MSLDGSDFYVVGAYDERPHIAIVSYSMLIGKTYGMHGALMLSHISESRGTSHHPFTVI